MPVLVMQCARYGSLADFQASPRVLNGPTKARLSLDVAKGLLALHGCRIIHGDVKSENILLDHTSNREEFHFLIGKIADLGRALLDVWEDTEFPNGIGGTVPWMAPEASRKLRGFSAVQKTDIYSFGMLLWRVFADDFRGIQFSRQIFAKLSNQGGVLPVAQQSIFGSRQWLPLNRLRNISTLLTRRPYIQRIFIATDCRNTPGQRTA